MQAMLSMAARVEESLNRVFISSGWLGARDSWMRFGFALVIACDLFVGVHALVTSAFRTAYDEFRECIKRVTNCFRNRFESSCANDVTRSCLSVMGRCKRVTHDLS